MNTILSSTPPPKRLEEIATYILAIEQEAEGLLDGLLKGATK